MRAGRDYDDIVKRSLTHVHKNGNVLSRYVLVFFPIVVTIYTSCYVHRCRQELLHGHLPPTSTSYRLREAYCLVIVAAIGLNTACILRTFSTELYGAVSSV